MEAGLLDVYLFVYGSFLALAAASIVMFINLHRKKKEPVGSGADHLI